jgi:hypothetical protein
MSAWNHYIVTDSKPVYLEEMEHALQSVNPDFYIDGDLIVLQEEEELECGQVTIDRFDSPERLPYREFFEEQIKDKRNRSQLEAILKSARTLVTVQLVNMDFWWDNPPERTIAPLQQWLLANFEGALYVEGGEFYDHQGEIL